MNSYQEYEVQEIFRPRNINAIMSMSMDTDTYKTYLKPSQYEEIRKKYLKDDNARWNL